jgi:hypothetical protein
VSIRGVGATVATAVVGLSSLVAAQFETRANVPSQNNPYSVAVGDFNRDGILDVAQVNADSAGSVEILLGNGDGTFRHGATYQVGDYPFYAAAASLRNNGLLDLVIGSGSVYVMLGNGDGTFEPAVAYPATGGAGMVSVGNFTGAGGLDVLALEEFGCGCLQVFPGNGDGTLSPPITTPLPYGMSGYAIAAADFNHDGKLDVAVTGEASPSFQVAILLGSGDGTFNPNGFYAVPEDPGSVTTGYFTSNKGKIDLAVASSLGNNVSVLLGNGDGTFQQPVLYGAGLPTWVVAQDLDGDGKVDLAASNAGQVFSKTSGITVFRGNGDGTFEAGSFYQAGKEGNYVTAGDFNGDHKPDLIMVDFDGGGVYTLLNTGAARLSPSTPLNFKAQAVGTTSVAQTVTLTNAGTTELKIQSITASAEFSVKSTCGARVAPGANCTITAAFSPTKQGAQQGTITIIDNASSKPQVIELLGTGT